MSETPTGDKPGNSPGDAKREELKMKLLGDLVEVISGVAKGISETDGKIALVTEAVATLISKYGDRLPEVFSARSEILEVVRNASEGGGPGPSVARIGDARGLDLGWLNPLGEFIKEISGFVKDEKKFLLAIALLIICDKPCECICDYIKAP